MEQPATYHRCPQDLSRLMEIRQLDKLHKEQVLRAEIQRQLQNDTVEPLVKELLRQKYADILKPPTKISLLPKDKQEKRRIAQKKSYEKHKAKRLEGMKQWRSNNKDYSREWRNKHPNYQNEWHKKNKLTKLNLTNNKPMVEYTNEH